MVFMHYLLLLACWITASSCFNEENDLGICTDLSCAPRRVLLDQIRLLQDRIHEEPLASKSGAETCSCQPNPCQNGGRCEVDQHSPVTKYTCKCPENTYGVNCETVIFCEATSCAQNCRVLNQQRVCTCKPGFSGDPTKPDGCQQKTVEACMRNDPHYQTFDGLYFDYQGLCPYIFSTPCNGLAGGYDNFTVKARNEPWGAAATVREAEIVMYGNTIYIDEKTKLVTFNGFEINVPYTWQGDEGQQIEITTTGNAFYVKNVKDSVTVTLAHYLLCIRIPEVDVFRGQCTLCGLAGNWDGNYQNDVVASRNCSSTNVTTTYIGTIANAVWDEWRIGEFNGTTYDNCTSSANAPEPACKDSPSAMQKCQPIMEANNGTGPFANCRTMGVINIQPAYRDCIYDVCANTSLCTIYTSFVQQCMNYLPNTDVGPWRSQLNCPMICPANSVYKSCTTTCPATCAAPNKPAICNSGCMEGCECDAGYLLDTSQLERTTCVRREQCGCADDCGMVHKEKSFWLSDNCNTKHSCIDGKHVSMFSPCNTNAECVKSGADQKCVCKNGFVGDGYNCTCTDASICGDNGTCPRKKAFTPPPVVPYCESNWAEWGAWTACTASCGMCGSQKRTRECTAAQKPVGVQTAMVCQQQCQGPNAERQTCPQGECPMLTRSCCPGFHKGYNATQNAVVCLSD